jgi:hypothetical protein
MEKKMRLYRVRMTDPDAPLGWRIGKLYATSDPFETDVELPSDAIEAFREAMEVHPLVDYYFPIEEEEEV